MAEIFSQGLLTDSSKVLEWRKTFLDNKPFRWFRINNVLDDSVLDDVERQVMSEAEFYTKDNDLFSFKQTMDLTEAIPNGIVHEVVQKLYGNEFRDMLSEVTGATLTDTIDVTASVYTKTNTLLCHDDRLLGRRLAYIFYAVSSDWTSEDGGTLDLFTVDKDGFPDCISDSLVPVRNSLLVFEVCPQSYHQVAEVLGDGYRLTLGGWFHGPSATNLPTPIVTDLNTPGRIDTIPDLLEMKIPVGGCPLEKWIKPLYLQEANLADACKRFGEDSSIQLLEFLVDSAYQELFSALDSLKEWSSVGPYNRRRFDVAKEDACPSIVRDFFNAFQSAEMVAFLGKLTGLKILKVSARLRKFSQGCYELAYDGNPEADISGLDVNLCFTNEWAETENLSGFLIYSDAGQEEPLVCIEPTSNSLNVVYRAEKGTQAFIKYVDGSMPGPRIDIMMTCRVE